MTSVSRERSRIVWDEVFEPIERKKKKYESENTIFKFSMMIGQ